MPTSPILLTSHSTPADLMVGRWVQLQQEMMVKQQQQHRASPAGSNLSQRSMSSTKSATHPYHHQQQPVESLSVSFAKLLVNQINGTSTTLLPSSGPKNSTGRKKKKTKQNKNHRSRSLSGGGRAASTSSVRNNKPVAQIDHVQEWLQQRSPHYAWWRKPATSTPTSITPAVATTSNSSSALNNNVSRPCTANSTLKSNTTINKSQPQHHASKLPRCILWFIYTGNPSKRPSTVAGNMNTVRQHSIRIEQQPLGGNSAIVFAADLHIGEEFAIVSRRQPGFTFSLTFYIDGVRHARLSGCCEVARNIHIPTRVGGPIGAFVLKAVQGGEQCQVCEKSVPFADPELFTVWPKSHHHHNNSKQHLNSSHESEETVLSSRKRTDGFKSNKLTLSSSQPTSSADVSSNSIDDNAALIDAPYSDVIPGSASIEEAYSIGSCPVETPDSIPSSLLPFPLD